MIEGEIAALAARRIRKAEIAALQDTIERMRAHGDDFEQRDAADRDFHVAIAEATGNGSFALVVEALWEQRRGELWTKMEEHFHTPALREKTLSDHAAIVAALKARDSAAARAAMHRHLARVEREFQRKWDALVPGTHARAGAAGNGKGASHACLEFATNGVEKIHSLQQTAAQEAHAVQRRKGEMS